MSKKIVKIDGKTYVVDSETKEVEEVEEETPVVEETPVEETPAEAPIEETPVEEAPVEEAPISEETIEKAAQEVAVKLGLDDIKKSITKLEKNENLRPSVLLNLQTLLQKDLSEMTSDEKIVGFFQAMLANDVVALKALSEGVAADGGILVPDEFRAEIIRDLAEGNYMRGEVRVIPMKRDTMTIPTLESKPLVSWTDENATKSTTTAHFGSATLTVYKLAAILYASDELIEDATDFDVVRLIVSLFSEAIGEEEDRVIWRGNGTTQPTGIVVARVAGAIAAIAAGGALSYDDVINLTYSLPGKYHRNAKYYCHRNLIRELRKLKDSNNQYLWQPSQQAGEPPTLGGYPVVEASQLPEKEMYFGDLKQTYWLGDKGQMTVKISQDTTQAFTRDQTAIRVVHRVAGNVVLGEACKALTGL